MTGIPDRLAGVADFAARATGAAATTAAKVASPAAAPAVTPQIAKVAKQFEAVFLRQMIGSMRQASLSDGLFDSSAQDQFRDMGDAKLADSMAGKGFGIAELLSRQISGTGATAATDPAASKKCGDAS